MTVSRMLTLLLVVGLVVGTTYGVSAGEAWGFSSLNFDDAARLVKDIALLRSINALELTDEQIEALLPALRGVRDILEKAQTDVLERLNKEKESLLRGEKSESDSSEVLKSVLLRAQQLKVAIEELKLKVIEVLTPEQLMKVRRMMPATGSAGVQSVVPLETISPVGATRRVGVIGRVGVMGRAGVMNRAGAANGIGVMSRTGFMNRADVMSRGQQMSFHAPTVKLRQIAPEQGVKVKPEAMQRQIDTELDTREGFTERLEALRETVKERLQDVLDEPVQLMERVIEDESVISRFRGRSL